LGLLLIFLVYPKDIHQSKLKNLDFLDEFPHRKDKMLGKGLK